MAEKLFPAVRSHTTTIPYCTCHRYRAAAARTWSWSRLRNLSSWGSTTWGTAMDNSILHLKPHLWRFLGISMNLEPVHEFYTVSFTSESVTENLHIGSSHAWQPRVCVRSQNLPLARSFVCRWHRKPCTFRGLVVHHQVVWRIFTTGMKWSATWNIYI